MSGVKISFRVLWQFVSEHSPLKPETQVKKLLEENEAFIRDGFFIYAEGKVHVADNVEVFCPRLYIYSCGL